MFRHRLECFNTTQEAKNAGYHTSQGGIMPSWLSLWFSLHVDTELAFLRSHLEHMHSALQDREDTISKMIQQEEARRNEMDDIEVAFFDDFCADLWNETYKLSQLSYSSFIILWYSFVETELIRFCRKLGMPPNYTKGNGIDRAKNFLREERGYQIDNTHWSKLRNIQDIRNLIVHSGTTLDLFRSRPNGQFIEYSREGEEVRYIKMKSHILTYLRDNNMITETSPFYIEIDPKPQYCEELIGLARDLLQKICDDF
jgi:hypothetical protein